MLKKILIGIAALALVLLGITATRPSTYRVERSAVIPAPSSMIFPEINDLRRWARWSPWDKLDPNMKRTFSGADQGTGAVYAWEGNDQVGKGQLAITESVPDQRVTYKLEFIEPWQAEATTTFVLQPTSEGTQVTWSMEGENDLLGKFFSLFLDMEGMIGADYEKGLANLTNVVAVAVEAQKAQAAAQATPAQADAAQAGTSPAGTGTAPSPTAKPKQ